MPKGGIAVSVFFPHEKPHYPRLRLILPKHPVTVLKGAPDTPEYRIHGRVRGVDVEVWHSTRLAGVTFPNTGAPELFDVRPGWRTLRDVEPYPPVEPFAHGLLEVGDDNLVYWETSGNPHGKAALVVHGGPGSGCGPGSRRYFDPDRYLVVQFDQRGCGQSAPKASDPSTDMSVNTTQHLISDMELLREQLEIERWLLYGGSWGSTLILAYAEQHPQRVAAIVLLGATMTRRSEIDWLYRGVARFFPEQWAQFRSVVDDDDVVAGYARLMASSDSGIRERAAQAWLAWEDAVISLEPNGRPNAYSDRPPDAQLAFVRICTHYFSHGAWLEEGQLLRDAHRLAGIAGIVIHGRLDLGSPLATAWELTHAWRNAELVVVSDSGHTGSDAMRQAALAASERFKDLPA
jgi:proline iminopeptidase